MKVMTAFAGAPCTGRATGAALQLTKRSLGSAVPAHGSRAAAGVQYQTSRQAQLRASASVIRWQTLYPQLTQCVAKHIRRGANDGGSQEWVA